MLGKKYDEDGKIDLNNIYNQPDPQKYYSTLSQLDYRIPQEASTAFRRLFEARREQKGAPNLKVVDVGCSYGVNAAVLEHGLDMGRLARLYGPEAPDSRDALLERDRRLFDEPADRTLNIVGVDVAANAVDYAVEAGIMDGGLSTDLEAQPLESPDAELVAGADFIISTGCVGYVTETTLERLLEPSLDNQTWMAHFVLRMFSFEAVEENLAEHGYVTEKVDGLVPQRRFASKEEQEHVLDNLAALDIDPTGAEADGWYFAELYVSRPEAMASALSASEIVGSL